MIFAMSLPCWTCRGCKNVVEWCDAVPVLDGEKCDGFVHLECVE